MILKYGLLGRTDIHLLLAHPAPHSKFIHVLVMPYGLQNTKMAAQPRSASVISSSQFSPSPTLDASERYENIDQTQERSFYFAFELQSNFLV
jgi:hypothetical protein